MGILSAILGGAGMALSALGASKDRKLVKKQIKMQDEYAREGIQIKVADAKKAGIHPLYALGAQGISYSPISVGGGPDYASGFANMGANLDDVLNKTRSRGTDAVMEKLAVENAALQNDYLRSQIRKNEVAGLPPVATGASLDPTTGIRLPIIDKTVNPTDPKFAQKVQDAWGEAPEWLLGVLQMAKDVDAQVTWSDLWNAIKPRLTYKGSMGGYDVY